MRSILLLVLFLEMANLSSAQESADALSAFVNSEELKNASVGFSLLDPSEKKFSLMIPKKVWRQLLR